MHRYVCFILILVVSFTILNCKDKVVDPGEIPQAIHFIAHGSDLEIKERGIDADDNLDGISLIWRAPGYDEITSVEIYRSDTEAGDYEKLVAVFLPDTLFVDTRAAFRKRYYYYVVGVTEDGQNTQTSDTLSYMLLEKVTDQSPRGSTSDSIPRFFWRDPNQAHEYIIKVIEADSEDPVWIRQLVSNYEEMMQTTYNFDGQTEISSLESGKDYLWRVDVIGAQENSGSESRWIPISIQ